MARPLRPDNSSVGTIDVFDGNFTKALYLRSKPGNQLEHLLGYGPQRLSGGWWLVFALQLPVPSNFEFGGYSHFSGSRIGDPKLGKSRAHVEDELRRDLGTNDLTGAKRHHIGNLEIAGPNRLAKVIPVNPGSDYPAGAGIYQCNIPNGVRCKVAAFVGPGQVYLGMYG